MENAYIKEFNDFLEEMNKRRKEISALYSKLDLQRQDLLHFLELEKYDAVIMMKISKKIVDVSKKRREAKYKLSELDAILSRMKSPLKDRKEIVNNKSKYKTDILKEFI